MCRKVVKTLVALESSRKSSVSQPSHPNSLIISSKMTTSSTGITGLVSNLIFGAGSSTSSAANNGNGNDNDDNTSHNKKKIVYERPPTLYDLPQLVEDVLQQRGKSATIAAKKIYELCDVAHKKNRIPMVCSTKYDVLGALTECLTHLDDEYETDDDENETDDGGGDGDGNCIDTNNSGEGEDDDVGADSSNDDSGTGGDDNDSKKPHASSNPQDNSNHVEDTPSNGAPSTATDEASNHRSSDDGTNTDQLATAITTVVKNTKTTKKNEKLHFVCLALNNLSIPDENKRIMALERGSRILIRNLSRVIAAGRKEAYLCCICLMNLSFLESSSTKILQYQPKQTTPWVPPSSSLSSQNNDKNNDANNMDDDNDSNNNNNNEGSLLKTSTAVASKAALRTKAAAKKVGLILLRGGRTVPSPLENPNSLLRILQDLLAHASRGTADFRWAFGLLSSLSKHPDNAALIGQTAIPRVAIENLRVSKTKNPKEWNPNSLEDFSLLLLLYLSSACYNDATAAMSTSLFDAATAQAALDVLVPVMERAEGTLQGLKATMICAFLEAPWSSFPKYGIPAAACLSELMGNTYERVGKKGVYNRNVFSLHMATKAYGDLARSAAKADKEETVQEQQQEQEHHTPNENNRGKKEQSTPAKPQIIGTSSQHTKVVALPTAVALLFQIIADVALISSPDAMDSTEHSDDGPHRADMRAAEYAVSAVNALLPALLKPDGPPRYSRQTEKACSQLQYMLTSYTKKATCSIAAKARAKEAAEQISEASTSAMPILEASYDLWVQYQSSYF